MIISKSMFRLSTPSIILVGYGLAIEWKFQKPIGGEKFFKNEPIRYVNLTK